MVKIVDIWNDDHCFKHYLELKIINSIEKANEFFKDLHEEVLHDNVISDKDANNENVDKRIQW